MKISTTIAFSVFALTPLVNGSPLTDIVACPAVIMPTPPILAYPSGTAVSGLELSNQSGIATLTKAGLEAGWNFGNGGLGYPWCPTSSWLNIVDSIRPWKPLVWGRSQTTTTWKAGYGKYLTASATTTYSESDVFLACKPLGLTAAEFAAAPKWTLFLLTDGTLPAATDETLVKVELQSCIKTKLLVASGTAGAIL